MRYRLVSKHIHFFRSGSEAKSGRLYQRLYRWSISQDQWRSQFLHSRGSSKQPRGLPIEGVPKDGLTAADSSKDDDSAGDGGSNGEDAENTNNGDASNFLLDKRVPRLHSRVADLNARAAVSAVSRYLVDCIRVVNFLALGEDENQTKEPCPKSEPKETLIGPPRGCRRGAHTRSYGVIGFTLYLFRLLRKPIGGGFV
jgi:hypothetical protein